MMLKPPIVLLDCDGVLSDFDSKAVELLNRLTDKSYVVDDIKGWDVFSSLGHADLEYELDKAINEDEFCLSLEVYPGVENALKELRKISEVVCLTASYRSMAWPGQRNKWLEDRLGFDSKHRIQAHSKYLVYGSVFVDDKGSNVEEWKQFWDDGEALMWSRPHNRSHTPTGVVRIDSWDQVIEAVEKKRGKR